MQDAAIIGAGPAGAIAAIELRRLGLDVLLIEQHRFPRDKVCGECLSSVGIDVLEELGLAASIAKLEGALLHINCLKMPLCVLRGLENVKC